jgi:hypothetical protein
VNRSGVGAYPGTFDPPTVAHLAIATAAREQAGLDRVVLVVSKQPLGKKPAVPKLEHRLSVLEAMAARREWLEVSVTDKRLISDVVAGFDAVIMGSDKWLQVLDPDWYGGSVPGRDAAVAALPRLLLAERAPGALDGVPLPAGTLRLDLSAAHAAVSSTAARAGRVEWMVEEAANFDAATGAWSQPERYLRLHGSDGTGEPFSDRSAD